MELWVVVVVGWFLLFFYNFVRTVELEFITAKWGGYIYSLGWAVVRHGLFHQFRVEL